MFHGSIVAIVTPMKTSGEIDFQSLSNLVDMHLANQTDGIVVLGTTGEAPTLDEAEGEKIVRAVIGQVNGKIPVIVGSGTYCTRKTIKMTERAMQLGADACLLITPYYNRPTQEGLFQHYSQVAAQVPIPQILYNNPIRTGCDLLPETVERLAHISNIVGIKEGNLDRVRTIIEKCGKHIDVFSADDISGLDIMLHGGKGVISVTSNIAPRLMHDMCKAALNGQTELALEIDEKLRALHKCVFIQPNPIPMKWALHSIGLIPDGIRLPLTKLDEKYHQTVKDALQYAGILAKTD